ncbi:unnamed protein product [Laminaria digitata]
MTPVGKDPAALKKAREEAAQKIKDTQDAKIGKISPAKAKEEEGEEEEGEDAGLTEIEKSRMRAKKWAKEQKDKKAAAAKKKKETAAKAAKAAKEGAAAAAATPKKRGAPRARK